MLSVFPTVQMLKDQTWLLLPSSELGVKKPGSSPAYAVDCVIPQHPFPLSGLTFPHLQNEERGETVFKDSE